MKKIIPISSLSLLFLGSAFAANYTANTSGDWSTPATWGQETNIPTAEDSVTIGQGVAVDVTGAVTAKNIQYVGGYNSVGTLNISGEGNSLTFTSGSNLYYQYMMEINVTDKASLDLADSSWGNGGYYKINVDNATFSAGFGQLQGSKFTNEELEYDSGIYLTNGAVANATTGWNASINADDHVMNIVATDSSIVVADGKYLQGKSNNKNSKLYIELDNSTVNNIGTIGTGGENTGADLILKNGATVSGNGFKFRADGLNSVANFSVTDSKFTAMGEVNAYGENATLNFTVDNSTLSGLGTITAGGKNSTIELDISNKANVTGGATLIANAEGAKINSIISDASYTINGDHFISATGEGAKVTQVINNPVLFKTNNVYVGSKEGASTQFEIRNTTLSTGYFYLGADNYTDGNNFNGDLTKFANGTNELKIVNSTLEIGSVLKVLAYNNTSSKVILLSSKITQKGNSLTLGVDDKTSGGKATLQFGGFDGTTFYAAQAGSYYVPYEFKVLNTGEMRFVLGAENLTKIGEATQEAIFSAQYLKPIQGALVLDFSNVVGLDKGEYMVALMKCTSNQNMESINGMTADYNSLISASAIESDTVKLWQNDKGDYFEIKNSTLYAYVTVIPEPSTYAAIFGVLALAFVVYRRRK